MSFQSCVLFVKYLSVVFEVFENLEVSPRETDLGPDVMADEVIYPEDLEYFDSEAESDVELADTSSIKSQDKPKLR